MAKNLIPIIFTICLVICLPQQVKTDIYIWEDDQGNKHITDSAPTSNNAQNSRENRGEPATKKNPISKINRAQANIDLKNSLIDRYDSNYSLIKTLLDANMEAYDYLKKIPPTHVNNKILKGLSDRYYPNFSLIKTLFQKNKKDYKALQ